MMLNINFRYIKAKEEYRTDAITDKMIIDLQIGHVVKIEIAMHHIEVDEI